MIQQNLPQRKDFPNEICPFVFCSVPDSHYFSLRQPANSYADSHPSNPNSDSVSNLHALADPNYHTLADTLVHALSEFGRPKFRAYCDRHVREQGV